MSGESNRSPGRREKSLGGGATGERTPRPVSDTGPATGPPKSPSRIPKEFGRYRMIRRLGKGGMGTVFLAEDTHLERQVALKIPQFSSDDSQEMLERFYREARAAATMHHPNLCPVYDVSEFNGVHFLTMAYIEGRPLSDSIEPDNLMPTDVAAVIAWKLSLAMAEAHEKGIIHRDLKPSNIIVDQRDEPIVMDFGLARRNDSHDARLTKSGAVLGTPAYMAPEQIKGDVHAIGPCCDIYSLGVILFELLTGEIPFDGPIAAVLGQVLTQEPPRPSSIRTDLDPRLEAICLKMMAKSPEDRYASMNEVADALRGVLTEATGVMSHPSLPRSTAVSGDSTSRGLQFAAIVDTSLNHVRKVWSSLGNLVRKVWSSLWNQVRKMRSSIESLLTPKAKQLILATLGAVLFTIVFFVAYDFFRGETVPGRIGESDGGVALGDDTGGTADGGNRGTAGNGKSAPGRNGESDGGDPPGDGTVGTAGGGNSGTAGSGKSVTARRVITNSIGMKLAAIKPGEFTMGATNSQYSFDDERPRHSVRITKSFFIGVYEVRQTEYEAVMNENPSYFKFNGKNRPVESVSWSDAQEFCRRLSRKEGVEYRLPTEAEWEYACRAESKTEWHFGDVATGLGDYAWTSANSNGSTNEVGKLKPNQFGLYDVYGNVAEWCQDWYRFNYYAESSLLNPEGPDDRDAARLGYTKVVRGGSWDSTEATSRSAYRGTNSMMVRTSQTGFRVVRVVKDDDKK